MKKASSYRIHLFYSIFAYFLSILILKMINISVNYVNLAFICLIYSLLPDIDTNKSVIWKIISSVFILLFILYTSYLFAILFLCSIIIIFIIKHRGFTHTYISALILSLPLLYISLDLFLGGLLSYVSHLLVDNKIKIM